MPIDGVRPNTAASGKAGIVAGQNAMPAEVVEARVAALTAGLAACGSVPATVTPEAAPLAPGETAGASRHTGTVGTRTTGSGAGLSTGTAVAIGLGLTAVAAVIIWRKPLLRAVRGGTK